MRKFKILTVILIIIQTLNAGIEFPSYLNLMPVPKSLEVKEGKFLLDENFKMAVDGAGSDRLFKAASRAMDRLRGRTGLFIHQAYVTSGQQTDSAAMIIKIKRQGKLVLHEDESYELIVSPEKIFLNAETDIGALRGLETFLQLLDNNGEDYFFPACEIHDAPRFPWRGLLIDACRHFMPVEVVKRNLDGMAAVKMNVLHWHLSEDQGFRVECKSFPKLHELGSDGFYYTQNQIKEIIAYAADRGIRVMPEFDLPGHATSWLTACPEYASAPGPYKIERAWGVFDPAFDPTKEETYDFLGKVFKEMTALFPDEYFHIGGDENNGNQWAANEDIQAFMKKHSIKDNHALQSYFNKRLLNFLTKYNKKMVGWDEIFQEDLPNNIIIHSWRGREAMVESAKLGYQTILSNGWYIDLIQPASYHYQNDPLPADSPLNDEQKKLALGGEATMWAELVSPENVDSRIWPRTAAIAERLWSAEDVKNIDNMYKRLKIISFQLEELGLTHIKNYEMMLRRLTNNQDISALKNLVDVLEPLKKYERHRSRKMFSYSPLTRAVDAARPDQETARLFNRRVDHFLEGMKVSGELKTWLKMWKANDEKLQPVISGSPVLAEISPLSKDLAACAEIGLKALELIDADEKPSAEWIEEAKKVLEEAKKTKAQMELMIIPGVEKLVNKISE